MTLQQCTRADLLFVIDRMCRHSLNKWELEQALNDLAHEKEIARIEEAKKYAKLANDARKEYISTLAPYDGMKLLDIPMEVLKKADALQKQAAAADRKWAKLMGICLDKSKKGGEADA